MSAKWPPHLSDDGAKLRSDEERAAIRKVAALARAGTADPTGRKVQYGEGDGSFALDNWTCPTCRKRHMFADYFVINGERLAVTVYLSCQDGVESRWDIAKTDGSGLHWGGRWEDGAVAARRAPPVIKKDPTTYGQAIHGRSSKITVRRG